MFPVIEIRDVAVKFLKMVVQGQVDEAFEECVAENFTHHNFYFKGDRESLLQAMKENHREQPHKVFEVKHVIDQHHMVAVHSLLIPFPGGPRMATAHILRFEHDRIAEMWDLSHVIPEEKINEHGAF
jgi:predicted SnoaL-like aldol condensation-catalyzing enzyme